jgi:hypothetical protein
METMERPMTIAGTVVNGVIVPDSGACLPEGSRVRIELDPVYEYPHPLAPYDRGKELALLRERIAEAKAGVPGLSIEETFALVDAELRQVERENGT